MDVTPSLLGMAPSGISSIAVSNFLKILKISLCEWDVAVLHGLERVGRATEVEHCCSPYEVE